MKLISRSNSNHMNNSNDGDHITHTFYPIKRIYLLRHPTQKGKVVLHVDCVCNVNCYGDDDDTETITSCDPTNITEGCQRDCIPGFWTGTSYDICIQFLEANHVIFDPSSVINQSLAVVDQDERIDNFGIATPITTIEVFHEKHNKKGFEIAEIAQRDFVENALLLVIDDPIMIVLFDDIDIIGSMNDEIKRQQTKIVIINYFRC